MGSYNCRKQARGVAILGKGGFSDKLLWYNFFNRDFFGFLSCFLENRFGFLFRDNFSCFWASFRAIKARKEDKRGNEDKDRDDNKSFDKIDFSAILVLG